MPKENSRQTLSGFDYQLDNQKKALKTSFHFSMRKQPPQKWLGMEWDN